MPSPTTLAISCGRRHAQGSGTVVTASLPEKRVLIKVEQPGSTASEARSIGRFGPSLVPAGARGLSLPRNALGRDHGVDALGIERMSHYDVLCKGARRLPFASRSAGGDQPLPRRAQFAKPNSSSGPPISIAVSRRSIAGTKRWR
jgi:hypothetical protein